MQQVAAMLSPLHYWFTLLPGGGSWCAQLEPAHLQVIVRRANAAGVLMVLQQGVLSALPDTKSLDSFLVS
jgi:hypothetical protein